MEDLVLKAIILIPLRRLTAAAALLIDDAALQWACLCLRIGLFASGTCGNQGADAGATWRWQR